MGLPSIREAAASRLSEVVVVENMLVRGEPCRLFCVLVGAARFTNDFRGTRRPNAKLTMSPATFALVLEACTPNGVGIASRAEITINYGVEFDMSTKIARTSTEDDAKFMGMLDKFFVRAANTENDADMGVQAHCLQNLSMFKFRQGLDCDPSRLVTW